MYSLLNRGGVGYLQAYMRERLDDLKTAEEEMEKSSEMIHNG